MFQCCGQIAVGLVKCLHSVQELVGSLTGEMGGKIAQFLGVVDVVIKHVLQNSHGLGIGCAAFGVKMLVVMIMMMVMVIVAVSVLVGVSMGMLVVVMAHE